MTYREPEVPTPKEIVFYEIRRIIERHQDWWHENAGEAVIGDTWPVATEIMHLVDRHYTENSLGTEE